MRKTHTVPSTRIVTDAIICDWCGSEASHEDAWPYPDVPEDADWRDRDLNTQDAAVNARWGISYPETGWGKEVKIDICARCFVDRLLPLLRQHGVNFEIKEWDW